MTVAEALPAERLTTGLEDVAHWYCCNPDISLCGLDLSGWGDVDPVPSEEDCPLCADVYDTERPCGAADCPVRPGYPRAGWSA